MSLRVARALERDGIGVRVVDLRWLAPLPVDDILREATATGRVLVVDETRRTGGVSEQIVADLLDAGFPAISRVTALDSFVPLGATANLVLPRGVRRSTPRARTTPTVSRDGAPVARRILADPPVDGLPQQVGVTGVPAVLLEQVEQHAAQAEPTEIAPLDVHELVKAAAGQRRRQPLLRAQHGAVVQRIQLGRRIVEGRAEHPHVVVVTSGGPPRDAQGSPSGAPDNQTVNFWSSTTARCLSNPPRVRFDAPILVRRPVGVQAVGLPPEGGALPVQGTEQMLQFGTGQRRFPRWRHPSAGRVRTAASSAHRRPALCCPRCCRA